MKKRVLAVIAAIAAVVVSFSFITSAYAIGEPTDVITDLTDGLIVDTSGLNADLGQIWLSGSSATLDDMNTYPNGPTLISISGDDALFYWVDMWDANGYIGSGFGTLTISFPVAEPGIYTVYQFTSAGNLITFGPIASANDYVAITVSSLSDFALVKIDDLPSVPEPTDVITDLTDGLIVDTSGLNADLGSVLITGGEVDPAEVESAYPGFFAIAGTNASFFFVDMIDTATGANIKSGFGLLTLTFPVAEPGIYKVHQLSSDGTISEYTVASVDGFITITVSHLSYFAVTRIGDLLLTGASTKSPATGAHLPLSLVVIAVGAVMAAGALSGIVWQRRRPNN